MWGTIIMSVFLVMNVYTFVQGLRTDPTGWVKQYRSIDWRLMLICLALVVAFVSQVIILYTLYEPLFGISWITALNAATGEDTAVRNAVTFGLDIKFVGLALCLLILTQLPRLARIEEEIFRDGTENWREALPRSLRFGLIHMVVGVPFGAALAIAVFGLVLTAFYFRGGVELSTRAHFQYNLILFAIVTVGAIITTFS